MKKNIGITLVIVVLLGAVLFVMTNKKDPGNIEMGAILNLTGTFASLGENSKNGMALAVKEINENGGVLGRKIVVDYQDNNGDNPKGALDALYNLANKNVRLIVGPNLTPSGTVVAPVAEKTDVVLVSPSLGTEKFHQASMRAVSIYPVSKFESLALAEYLYKEKGYRRIAIFGSKQEWENDQAQFVKQKFEELGGTVTTVQTPMVDNIDLRSESLKIKTSNPEAVVFTNYGETGIASKRLRAVGVTQPFYSIIIFTSQIEVAHGAMEGLIFESTDTTDTDFSKKYQEAYKKEASFPANQSYDAVYLLTKAIENSKSTNPAQVAEALSKIKEFKGASGDITFDNDGNAHKPILYYQIKNGEIVPLKK